MRSQSAMLVFKTSRGAIATVPSSGFEASGEHFRMDRGRISQLKLFCKRPAKSLLLLRVSGSVVRVVCVGDELSFRLTPRQRFPTLRTAVPLCKGERKEYVEVFSACRCTVSRDALCLLGKSRFRLLKRFGSRQEKASRCNGNGASTDEHFCDGSVEKCCAGVNFTGP